MFSIQVENLQWLEGGDERDDLCLHGDATAIIGEDRFEDSATVSATALYLLKSLREDHIIFTDNQMLPCCGHLLIPNDDLTNVHISGCPNGIDWSVIHEGDSVVLITETGRRTSVPFEEYKRTVFSFADKIEAFYLNSKPKRLPEDEFDRNGYIAFWNEWHRRRYEYD